MWCSAARIGGISEVQVFGYGWRNKETDLEIACLRERGTESDRS